MHKKSKVPYGTDLGFTILDTGLDEKNTCRIILMKFEIT